MSQVITHKNYQLHTTLPVWLLYLGNNYIWLFLNILKYYTSLSQWSLVKKNLKKNTLKYLWIFFFNVSLKNNTSGLKCLPCRCTCSNTYFEYFFTYLSVSVGTRTLFKSIFYETGFMYPLKICIELNRVKNSSLAQWFCRSFTLCKGRVDVACRSRPVARASLFQHDFVDAFRVIFTGHEQQPGLDRHPLSAGDVARAPHAPLGHRTAAR